jgi:hypothetical protein
MRLGSVKSRRLIEEKSWLDMRTRSGWLRGGLVKDARQSIGARELEAIADEP